MTALRVRARRRALAAPSLAALALLNGCATLGGNVKGSFSCQAPAGVCAPSSTIDDRALAMISGDAGDMAVPAGPYVPPPAVSRKTTIAAARATVPATGASRSSERVLRVVFQPYIDEAGRFHEASAVRTVVRGEWQAAAATPSATPALGNGPAGTSLADAVDRADRPIALADTDPDLPDPAAVAAARARRPDPVAAIRADVAARLAAPRRRAAARRARAIVAARPLGTARAIAPVSASAGSVAQPHPSGVPAAAAAATLVRSDPRWTAVKAATPEAVRSAAAAAGAPVLRATSFPGVTNEEN